MPGIDIELDLAELFAATFKRVCGILQLDVNDPLRESVASQIIEIVVKGERDSHTLYERVLAEVAGAFRALCPGCSKPMTLIRDVELSRTNKSVFECAPNDQILAQELVNRLEVRLRS